MQGDMGQWGSSGGYQEPILGVSFFSCCLVSSPAQIAQFSWHKRITHSVGFETCLVDLSNRITETILFQPKKT